jgi:nickel transport protein
MFTSFYKSYFCTKICIAWIIITSITAYPIYAHKLSVFAYVVGDTVITESYSADGTPVRGGDIKVFDSESSLLLNGETDEGGLFSFRIPKRVDLTIILEDSTGHRALYRLSAAQLAASSPTSEVESRDTPNIEDIRLVVAEEVAKQLEPLHERVSQLQREKKLPVREVFAGIGYVLGLMGLVMYFQSRRKK